MKDESVRPLTEAIEARTLSPRAQLSARSRGRQRPEAECDIRTAFQRDRDRIIHSKAFRRLKGKTQVFVAPLGDHYRTRLTHTLEVAQVARTIARALRLNEDLTEAIALGHDLGHTPFGHAGEQVLDEIAPGGFRHNEQSLRVVDVLEREGQGLNLTWEVRDGILNHPGALRSATLEGQIIKLADRIAYLNHDIDDAIRGQVLAPTDLPRDVVQTLGATHGQRIERLVKGVIKASREGDEIGLEPDLAEAMDALRRFMFERVYTRSRPKLEESKARGMLRRLHDFYLEHPDALEVADWHRALVEAEVASEVGNGPLEQGREHPAPPAALRRLIADYLAGMTDRYAMAQYERHLMPAPWPANL